MSDISVNDFIDQQFAAGEAEKPPAPAEPAGEPPASEAPPAAAPESAAPAGEEEPKVYDAEYVRKLRDGEAKYRTRYAPFRDAFEGYEDGEVEAFLELAKQLREAPEAAAQRMIEAAKAIYGDRFPEVLEGEQGPKPLTREDLERELAERDAQREQQAAIASVEEKARSLGYQDDTADWRELMFLASTKHNGDLNAAHKAIEDRKAKIVEDYLKSKADKNGRFPAGTGGGQAAGESEPPSTGNTWADARNRLEAALDAKPGA